MTTLGLVPNPVTVDQLVDESLLPVTLAASGATPMTTRASCATVIVAPGP